MNERRRSQGASMLALMLAFIFFIVILGTGIYGYIFLTGSQKSLQEATDAAAINVAKQAMSGVYANLSVGASPTSYFDAAMTPLLGTTNLNVYGYNKAMSRALMVALNAADMQANDAKAAGVDLSSNGAIAQASALISRLQGGPTSIGGQLQQYLTSGVDGSGNQWALQAFNQIANGPLSSLSGSAATFDSTQFAAAYFTGNGQTTAVAPFSQQLASAWTPSAAAVSDGSPLTGYGSGLTAGTLSMVAVPADPSQAPHLISLTNFSDPTQNWSPNGICVPPNAFKIGASSTDKQTKAATYAKAAALLGGLPSIQGAQSMFANANTGDLIPQIKQIIAYLGTQPAEAQASGTTIGPTTAAIPGGYLVIDNSNSNTPNSVSGSAPGTNNVFSDELGVGITVDDTTSMFSDNGAVQNWQGFPHTPPAAGKSWDPKTDKLVTDIKKVPDISGLYNPDGSAATYGTAGAIPYASDSSSPPPTSLCTDQNSDAADPSSDPECVKLASPTAGGGLDPFDVAYHPGASASGNSTTPMASLTAAEVAKVAVGWAWEPVWSGKWPSPYSIPLSGVSPTGMRNWPNNRTPDQNNSHAWPYAPNPLFGWGAFMQSMGFGDTMLSGAPSWSDPNIVGKISHDGTVYSLFHQIDATDTAYNNFLPVFTTRVMQMGPLPPASNPTESVADLQTAISGQLDTLFRGTKLPIGSRYYVYLSQQTDSSTGKQQLVLTMDTTGPAWLAGTTATNASQALQSDLIANLNTLQNSPASTWNSSGNVTPAGSQTGAVQLDGVWNTSASHTFNAVNTIVNPIREWNIHDQIFTQSGNAAPGASTTIAQVSVTETAAYQKASGAYGLLGALKFQEAVSGSGTQYFWAPN